jgi:hypothetical protein
LAQCLPQPISLCSVQPHMGQRFSFSSPFSPSSM